MKWQSHIGLDIGLTSVKLVQLEPVDDKKFKLVSLGQVEAPKFENQLQWTASRVEVIKALVKGSHVSSRQVALSLPESQVYTRVVDMPFLEEPELSQAISWQAEQYIPIPLSDVVLKHQVLSLPEQGVPGAKMSVLLLAAPNEVLNNYMSVCLSAGLDVVAVETEVLAVIRALTFGIPAFPPSLLVHIGAETTTFCIYREGMLALTQSVGTGAVAITRAIGTELELDGAQAEQYKRSYGLDSSKLDGKVAAAAKPVVEYILAEGKRVLGAYESRDTSNREPVRRVVLSGGGSILPGIVPYITGSMGLEVQLGDPWFAVNLTDNQKLEIGETAPIFSVGVGLAMKIT
ncbi:type IV pilus assembly protein PilM [Candidatus Microgenomates bacterium]|nr:type IV pilus assembly protein PilM [Candidatus Microgenomates bacterium]